MLETVLQLYEQGQDINDVFEDGVLNQKYLITKII